MPLLPAMPGLEINHGLVPNLKPLARIFHTFSARDAARGWLARRPKRFEVGLYEDILSGEEGEANAASRPRRKSQQKRYEISGLASLGRVLTEPGHLKVPDGGEVGGVDGTYDRSTCAHRYKNFSGSVNWDID